MRQYGRVHTKFWTGAGSSLSIGGKALAVYLFTGPHSNAVGCFRLPIGYLVADLRVDGTEAKVLLDELVAADIIAWDQEWVWVRGFLMDNPVANPNHAKAYEPLVEAVPTSVSFYRDFIGSLSGTPFERPSACHVNVISIASRYHGVSDADAIRDGMPDPIPDGITNAKSIYRDKDRYGNGSGDVSRAREAAAETVAGTVHPSHVLIETFDQVIVEVFGPERARQRIGRDDSGIAVKWWDKGIRPSHVREICLPKQGKEKAAGKGPVKVMSYFDERFDDILLELPDFLRRSGPKSEVGNAA